MNRLRRILFLASRSVGDANAVQRGRIVPRTANRVIGRGVSRLLRSVWR